MAQRRETRPPIDEPLPQAGESLGERIDDHFDRLVPWFFAPAMAIMMAILEWWRHWFPYPPSPWGMTILAAAVTMLAGWRIWRAWPEIRNARLGYRGERAVGQALEELRAHGYRVFHDVKGAGDWNVDHVLVGPGGVFSVETKTRSKPARGGGKIVCDGSKIMVDGREMDRDALTQAKACARDVRSILRDLSGVVRHADHPGPGRRRRQP